MFSSRSYLDMHFIYIIPFSKVLCQKLTALQLVMKFPSFWKPTNHYHVHHNPLFFPILSHILPIHVSKSSLFKMYYYIFPLHTHTFSKQHNSFSCSYQNPLCISLLSHARNLPHPSYPPWYGNYNYVGRQLLILTFPHYWVFSHIIFLSPS